MTPTDPIAARLAEVDEQVLNETLGYEHTAEIYRAALEAALREKEALREWKEEAMTTLFNAGTAAAKLMDECEASRRENERLRELLQQAPVVRPVNAYPND